MNSNTPKPGPEPPFPENACPACECGEKSTVPPSESISKLIAECVTLRVAELPDRTSPDDWREAMIVTDSELRMIVQEEVEHEFNRNAAASPVPVARPRCPVCDSVERDVHRRGDWGVCNDQWHYQGWRDTTPVPREEVPNEVEILKARIRDLERDLRVRQQKLLEALAARGEVNREGLSADLVKQFCAEQELPWGFWVHSYKGRHVLANILQDFGQWLISRAALASRTSSEGRELSIQRINEELGIKDACPHCGSTNPDAPIIAECCVHVWHKQAR